MVRAARVVQRLRLRADSEGAVRHAMPALEDAFRTASLPDAGARLICVRRLQLGQVPANASAQSVSLLIERRFAEGGSKIVHAGEGAADGAQAVWFRDAFEAHEAAALKIAAGQALDDWFWPLAIPAITAAANDEKLRAIAFAIAATEEAPTGLPVWTASLVDAGYRSPLIAALRPGDGRALMRSAGINAVSTAARREHAVTPDDRNGPGSERARTARAEPHRVSDRGQRNEDSDDRLVFVELMTSRASGGAPQRPATTAPQPKATGGNPPAAMVPAPDVGARALREHGTPQPDARRELETLQPDAQREHRTLQPDAQRGTVEHQQIQPPAQRLVGPAEATGDAPRDEPAEAFPSASLREGRRGRPPSSSPDVHGIQRERSTSDAPHAFASPWQLPEGAPTAAGGLMFLLPVLERVGFAKWAEERGSGEPEPEVLAAAILYRLLSRLGVEEDDSAWQLALPTIDVPRRAGLKPRPYGTTLDELWLTTCRRYLRRHVRIGLASLVVRPARLAITPTHVDVFFRLNAADVRVRRVGLDIDPGWVRWFGRVVAFHYGDRPWN